MAAGKYPLVYDLQEPFRWMVDVAIINALENQVFTKKDFIRTENYVIRLSSAGTKKLLESVNVQLTNRTQFRGKSWEWGYVIIQKTGEFVNFLNGTNSNFEFNKPSPVLSRDDTPELREKVLGIGYYNWMKAGYSKGSLHYLKKNARSEKPFRIYGKMKDKLDAYSP
jgi:CRISPR-associated protein Cas1